MNARFEHNPASGPHRTAAAWMAAAMGCLLFATGCAQANQGQQADEDTTIVVPDSATTTPEYRGDGSIPPQRYVVRMSDGQRDWEVEFPEVARGYEVRIPLREDDRDVHAGYEPLTDADRELIDHLRRTDPDFEREGLYAGDEHTVDRQARREADEDLSVDDEDERQRTEADPAPTRPSYLKGIDEAQRLFEAGHYEMAMVTLSNLENAYPNDIRIKSMKGTLWLRLGREALARENWEQVLQIDPDNEPVREALRRLDAGEAQRSDELDDY